jgi:N-acetylglucosamine repressor
MIQLDHILENEAVTLVRVLEQIRREGPISQVEIGRKLGLGRAIVNIHVKKLLAQGVVVPTGDVEGSVGRPRVLLDLAREGKAVLGICLDSPYLSGAVMDFSNRLIVKRELDVSDVKSHVDLGQRIVELVVDLERSARKKGLSLYATCFSVPGVLEVDSGKILNYVNMPAANGLDVKQVLKSLLNVPIYIVPLGAAIYWGGLEAQQANQQVFHVIWDLGVGMMFGRGFEIGFKEYRRHAKSVNSNIRDIGHAVLWPNGKRCYCGRRGCMEAYLGGRAITDRWNAQHPDEELAFSGLLNLARNDDSRCLKLISRHARRLGEALGWIFAVHQPSYIKLSGQIPDSAPIARDAFWHGVTRRMGDGANRIQFNYVGDTRAVQVVGSCRLALHVRFNRPLLDMVSADDTSEGAVAFVLG